MYTVNQNSSNSGRLAATLSPMVFALLFAAITLLGIGCSSDEGGGSDTNGPGGSSTPLAVSAMNPIGGSTDVNVSSSVTATFSRTVDPTTVTTSSFYINGVTGSVSANGSSATFTPAAPLQANTQYTVTITTGVRDMDGVGLNSNYTATFTTGTPPSANAGPDKDVSKNETVILQGSTSGSASTFTWTQILGPSVGPLGNTATPTFTAPDSVSNLIFTFSADGSPADTVVVWVLEDKSDAFWVHPSGDDANAGTRDMPLATLQQAIQMARDGAQGADIYIAEGTYNGTIGLAPGVSLYGGYDDVTWLRDPTNNVSTIMGGARAIIGNETNNLTIDGLHVYAADATTPNGSSVVVTLTRSAGVVISNNTLTAGRGADGTNGTTPDPPAKTSSGGSGEKAGACGNPGGGGGGPHGDGREGGKGGNGGAAGGFDGQKGESSGSNCGLAGKGGFAASGKPGDTGCNGGGGGSGAAGSDFGTVNKGVYLVSSGARGNRGGHGGGGGGGGGGAGSLLGCGGGGGGGGRGGTGGQGGSGGLGGGGSIGIIISDTSDVAIINNVITTANGGNAGYGAEGATGGAGGSGGSGGGSATAGWAGGKGGNGGKGGKGGYGGGGGGGPSIGIIEQGSTSTQLNLTFNLGNGGLGGARSDLAGHEGPNGLVAEVKKIE